jgi:hypothetical protein
MRFSWPGSSMLTLPTTDGGPGGPGVLRQGQIPTTDDGPCGPGQGSEQQRKPLSLYLRSRWGRPSGWTLIAIMVVLAAVVVYVFVFLMA